MGEPERQDAGNGTVQRRVDKDITYLEGLLDDEGKKVLERLLDNSAELERLQVCEGFKDGFRLGVQLTAAGFGNGNKP